MIGRFLDRLTRAQGRWARPLGEFNHRWLSALFRPLRPVKDLLNGTWLGHPLHPAATDIPIGTLLLAVVLDLAGQPAAAHLALGVTILFLVASAVTGLADYTDTDGAARERATVHGVLMVAGLALVNVSFLLRLGGAADATLPRILAIVAFLVITAGAYVGGDVVYLLGNMVSRHAWRGGGQKWIALEVDGGLTPDAIPEATPTKGKLGINTLVLVRQGTTIHALHDTCAHAGGPLSQGRLVDGCLECPWHASRFRLADGHHTQGPTVYDQPVYMVRLEGGRWEGRRRS